MGQTGTIKVKLGIKKSKNKSIHVNNILRQLRKQLSHVNTETNPVKQRTRQFKSGRSQIMDKSSPIVSGKLNLKSGKSQVNSGTA